MLKGSLLFGPWPFFGGVFFFLKGFVSKPSRILGRQPRKLGYFEVFKFQPSKIREIARQENAKGRGVRLATLKFSKLKCQTFPGILVLASIRLTRARLAPKISTYDAPFNVVGHLGSPVFKNQVLYILLIGAVDDIFEKSR